MARKKKRKKFDKWWVPYIAHSDQEIERGRWVYDAIIEEVPENACFDVLLQARDHCVALCQTLHPRKDEEKWLFYAAVFYGIGMLLRERVEIYEEVSGD